MNRRGFIGSLLALPLVNKLPVAKPMVIAQPKAVSADPTRVYRDARSSSQWTVTSSGAVNLDAIYTYTES